MRAFRLMAVVALAAASVSAQDGDDVLPDVPEGAQAVSLSGQPLFSPEPSAKALENYEQAKLDYDRDPDDADAIIWLGRRTAYLGDYRGAIRVFSEGVEKHPDDPRMLRHRGHRYISIREFQRAIDDLEKASRLIEGTENETEPDGLPNAQGIPVSSLHGNIWYHLGLAYYLVQDWGERVPRVQERLRRRPKRRQPRLHHALALLDRAAHGRRGAGPRRARADHGGDEHHRELQLPPAVPLLPG